MSSTDFEASVVCEDTSAPCAAFLPAINDCTGTEFFACSFEDMRIEIGTGTYTQILALKDTLSLEMEPDGDGISYCGPRIYVLNEPKPCWAALEGDKLTIYSDLITDAEEIA